jgi:hypothetical protein
MPWCRAAGPLARGACAAADDKTYIANAAGRTRAHRKAGRGGTRSPTTATPHQSFAVAIFCRSADAACVFPSDARVCIVLLAEARDAARHRCSANVEIVHKNKVWWL